ncbi:MAG TPA: VWA domain-containing protein, partial [Myxococcaceae bacterium]|nr:VWA domain-containing protein [Myxococcaceae bacterium]
LELSFDALFPENPDTLPRGEAPLPSELERVADILDAIAEAGGLAPADLRGTESVALLSHLLSLYALTPPRYLVILAASAAGSPVRQNLERVRLICRPFG